MRSDQLCRKDRLRNPSEELSSMDNQEPILVTSTVLANESEPALAASAEQGICGARKFRSPSTYSAATKAFLQITGGGDV